ncbi:hypothetical protein [Kribbella sp. VKM Ac-2566]|uniref:hypothetical protein n=1 Tax=Kribbella sp. VKM Ac-2566 TaxID=2512218 RepID=UPI00106454BC|nr:hypothetical protein [Kribbella sp. VKM Ac-2566]
MKLNDRLQDLDTLVGEWDMEASIDGRSMGRSTATFSWHDSRGFLLMQVDPPAEIAPEWQQNSPLPISAAIGLDDHSAGFAMLYTRCAGRLPDLSDDLRGRAMGDAGASRAWIPPALRSHRRQRRRPDQRTMARLR